MVTVVWIALSLALLVVGSSADVCDSNNDRSGCNTGTESSRGSYTTVFESLTASRVPVVSGLSYDFYDQSCPPFRFVIQQAISQALQSNPMQAAGITRIMFHDCFVQGCDASLLLTGDGSEQSALPNQSLKSEALQLINDIKAQLEQACPSTVSCADLLSLATAEAIQQVNGPSMDVALGRRDSTSPADDQTVLNNLPSPRNNVSQNFPIFSNLGFSYTDFVALQGAHTLGNAQCAAFFDRLSPTVDPDLDSNLANTLLQLCPTNTTNSTHILDDTPNSFDNKFYKQALCGDVLLTSDSSLELDSNTMYLLKQFARSNSQFQSQFANSWLTMSQLSVLTGSAGEVRTNCTSNNAGTTPSSATSTPSSDSPPVSNYR